MLQKPPRAEKIGCLFGFVGILIGIIVANYGASSEVAAIRAADPDAVICGLPWLASLFVGTFFGGLTGTVLGMVLSYLLPKYKAKS